MEVAAQSASVKEILQFLYTLFLCTKSMAFKF